MKRLRLALAAAIAAAIGRYIVRTQRFRGGLQAFRRRMMQRMMNSMPEDSPPKLVVSLLPTLKQQNDRILALLEEQNELLRRRGRG